MGDGNSFPHALYFTARCSAISSRPDEANTTAARSRGAARSSGVQMCREGGTSKALTTPGVQRPPDD